MDNNYSIAVRSEKMVTVHNKSIKCHTGTANVSIEVEQKN